MRTVAPACIANIRIQIRIKYKQMYDDNELYLNSGNEWSYKRTWGKKLCSYKVGIESMIIRVCCRVHEQIFEAGNCRLLSLLVVGHISIVLSK